MLGVVNGLVSAIDDCYLVLPFLERKHVHSRDDRQQRPGAGPNLYDATFDALGGKSGKMDARGRLIYAHEGGRPIITTPIDGRAATAANGGTIGIAAVSRDHVLARHKAGIAHGGTAIESPPAERPDGSFVAYLRDPDGNKLTARTRPAR